MRYICGYCGEKMSGGVCRNLRCESNRQNDGCAVKKLGMAALAPSEKQLAYHADLRAKALALDPGIPVDPHIYECRHCLSVSIDNLQAAIRYLSKYGKPAK